MLLSYVPRHEEREFHEGKRWSLFRGRGAAAHTLTCWSAIAGSLIRTDGGPLCGAGPEPREDRGQDS